MQNPDKALTLLSSDLFTFASFITSSPQMTTTAVPSGISLSSWLLAVSAIATVGYQLLFFFVAAVFRFDKVTDLAGGSNFILVALLVFFLGPENTSTISVRQWVVTIGVIAWGVRLSGFLFYRILVTEEDSRFDGIREDLVKFSVFWLFQMVWVFATSLTVIYINGIDDIAALTYADYIGWALALLGLLIETVADAEKFSFRQRRDQDKRDAFIRNGTWAWSRHPNYFGELAFWWGIFITVSQSFATPQRSDPTGYFTLLSPGFITLLLLFGSGLPIVEVTSNKKLRQSESFRRYRDETSILIPLPPAMWRTLPPWLKAALFEWPMYAEGLDDPLAQDLIPPRAPTNQL